MGIKIGKEPSSLYSLNYPPLIPKIVGELEVWLNLPLLLFGRCALFKMVSFARLLYPLQTLLLLLKHRDIQILNKAVTIFLWKKGKPRVALTKLFLPRTEGGTNLRNIRVYNLACLLRTGIDWILQTSRYSNYELESNMVHPLNLVALHSSLQKIPTNIEQNLF